MRESKAVVLRDVALVIADLVRDEAAVAGSTLLQLEVFLDFLDAQLADPRAIAHRIMHVMLPAHPAHCVLDVIEGVVGPLDVVAHPYLVAHDDSAPKPRRVSRHPFKAEARARRHVNTPSEEG